MVREEFARILESLLILLIGGIIGICMEINIIGGNNPLL